MEQRRACFSWTVADTRLEPLTWPLSVTFDGKESRLNDDITGALLQQRRLRAISSRRSARSGRA